MHTTNGYRRITTDNFLQKLVIDPNCKKRLTWDVLSVFALSYDILTVPMIAFMVEEDDTIKSMFDLSIIVFWTLDMPMTLLSGFHTAGFVEMRPKEIFKNYSRRWLFLDLFVVSLDWCMLLLTYSAGNLVGIIRISKLVRIHRLLRLFRLLRVFKWPTWADNIADWLKSEALLTAFGIIKSMAVILVANHFLACLWYGVGTSGWDDQYSWVDRFIEENRSLDYWYTTALHWSITQFTPASMEVVPRNTLERSTAVLIITAAMVVFSYFISSITQAMSRLQQTNAHRSRQQDNLRRYISENGISLELGNRITAYLRTHKFMARRRVHEGDIDIFKILPGSMLVQLHCEVYMPMVLPHPFFHHLNEFDSIFVQEICHNALGEVSTAISQELFSQGSDPRYMYFLRSGVWEYVEDLGRAQGRDALQVEGKWLCEVVIWVQWQFTGRLSAVTPCECTWLDAPVFRKIVIRKHMFIGVCSEYARLFMQAVNASCLDDNRPYVPVEIWNDFDATQEMVHKAFERDELIVGEGQEDERVPSSRQGHNSHKRLRVLRSWSPKNLIPSIGTLFGERSSSF